MCGITGFLDLRASTSDDDLQRWSQGMASSVCHRGPDYGAAWVDAAAGIALAHRRLSIVDLSPQGHQPMRSACGRFVVSLNGEFYNHREIRLALERDGSAPAWRGHSDTEVALAAICRWGLQPAVQRFVGMFALVLWDRESRTLHLVRDRLGEKPLYYGRIGRYFLFGSELKALRAHPGWSGTIDREAVGLMMRYSYVPAPRSIYAGISKLVPGTILSIPAGSDPDAARPVAYWSAADAYAQGARHPFLGSDDEAIEELRTHLSNAIGLQMQADVPLGAFLSGGIDSSAVVALMQAQSSRRVRTFTIGVADRAYDEAAAAKQIAAHLGTDHTELYVSPADALDVIPRLPAMYDEPFADSSQIPTYLVSRLARQHVTVSLSGDGGDELFGGYNRHLWAAGIWQRAARVPRPIRSGIARLITTLGPTSWDRLVEAMPLGRWRQSAPRLLGDKLHKVARLLRARDAGDAYLGLVSQWTPEEIAIGASSASGHERSLDVPPGVATLSEVMMYMDLVGYLPNDILVKLDRASMAVSLESRVPFLDHRVVEFAATLPLRMKIRDGEGKWILRRLVESHVPRHLLERRKSGFGVPLERWLRGELREWAEDLLSEDTLTRGGYLRSDVVRARWAEHLSGRNNWQHQLWNVLSFQAWLEHESTSPEGVAASGAFALASD
jgi:asparagine synthase (glutamine-hydrolysing)